MSGQPNVMIISKFFHPELTPRAFRTTELARELVRLGCQVTVCIPKEKVRPEFKDEFGIDMSSLGSTNFHEIRYDYKGTFLQFLARGMRRFLDLLIYYPNVQWAYKSSSLLKRNPEFDLLITIAAPHSIHWGAAWSYKQWSKIKKKVWIADCGDPFMGVTTDSFKKPFYFKYIEKYWCRKCDFLTVPFEGAIDGYYEEFKNKIKVIPQGFDFADKISEGFYEKNKIVTFGYAGGFIKGVRDPNPLLEYLIGKKVPFRFIVYSKNDNIIPDEYKAPGGFVEVRKYIPRKKLIEELGRLDFLINFDNRNNTQQPSKLIDYYFTGRPILSIDSYNFDRGLVDEFFKGEYRGQYRHSNIEDYNIINVASKFINLYKSSIENDK